LPGFQLDDVSVCCEVNVVWDWCRDVSGIDGYFVTPHTVLLFSQMTTFSFSRQL